MPSPTRTLLCVFGLSLELSLNVAAHDLLRRGGSYTWRVHARDVNEDKDLGDFNLGAMGPVLSFSVAP